MYSADCGCPKLMEDGTLKPETSKATKTLASRASKAKFSSPPARRLQRTPTNTNNTILVMLLWKKDSVRILFTLTCNRAIALGFYSMHCIPWDADEVLKSDQCRNTWYSIVDWITCICESGEEMEVEKPAEEFSKEELRRQLYSSLRSTGVLDSMKVCYFSSFLVKLFQYYDILDLYHFHCSCSMAGNYHDCCFCWWTEIVRKKSILIAVVSRCLELN